MNVSHFMYPLHGTGSISCCGRVFQGIFPRLITVCQTVLSQDGKKSGWISPEWRQTTSGQLGRSAKSQYGHTVHNTQNMVHWAWDQTFLVHITARFDRIVKLNQGDLLKKKPFSDTPGPSWICMLQNKAECTVNFNRKGSSIRSDRATAVLICSLERCILMVISIFNVNIELIQTMSTQSHIELIQTICQHSLMRPASSLIISVQGPMRTLYLINELKNNLTPVWIRPLNFSINARTQSYFHCALTQSETVSVDYFSEQRLDYIVQQAENHHKSLIENPVSAKKL